MKRSAHNTLLNDTAPSLTMGRYHLEIFKGSTMILAPLEDNQKWSTFP